MGKTRMTSPLFFVKELPEKGPLQLDTTTEHHLRVRRQRENGQSIIISDGENYAQATIAIEKKKVWAHYDTVHLCPQSDSGLHLYLAVIKPEPLAWAVQKATEIGVETVSLIWSERSQRSYWSERGHEHLQKVIAASCSQSGQYRLPRLNPPRNLHELSFDNEALWLIADLPEHLSDGLLPKRNNHQPVHYLIGPEGGWSEQDRQSVPKHVVRCSLPGPTLRAETAAVAFSTLLRWACG